MGITKELKQYVDNRASKTLVKMEKTEEWRKLIAEHEKLLDTLSEILPEDCKEKLDMLMDNMMSQHSMGNCMIYKIGLIDGISLKNEIAE